MTRSNIPNSSDFSSFSSNSDFSDSNFSLDSNGLNGPIGIISAQTPIFTGMASKSLRGFQGKSPSALLTAWRRFTDPFFKSVDHMKVVKNQAMWCMFQVSDSHAEIHQSLRNGRHSWKKVVPCGSVHQCPICSGIARRKKAILIQKLINEHLKHGGGVALLTVTAPFYRDDSLDFAVDGLLNSIKGFWSSRARKDICQRLGMIGSIRNLEITWGRENGWHPHSHFLLFVDDEFDCSDLEYAFYPVWKTYVEKRIGRTPSPKHGVNVVRGETAAEYLVKSGLEDKPDLAREITHAHTKSAKGERLTQWGILSKAADDEINRDFWLRLLSDYVIATHGRHTVSRFDSLMKFYGIDKKEQDAIVEHEFETVLKARVPYELYRKIYAKYLLEDALAIFDAGGDLENLIEFVESHSCTSE